MVKFLRLEIEGIDVLAEAAIVPLPGAEIAKNAGVGNRIAIGAVRRQSAAVERQRLCQATLRRHREKSSEPAVPRHATRKEDHVLRIGRPGHDHVVGTPAHRCIFDDVRMEGKPSRRASAGWHDIDILVALIESGKGDRATVGGEARHQIVTGICSQAACHAAPAAHLPNIAVCLEDDPARMQCGKPHKRPVVARGGIRRTDQAR